MRNLLPSLVLAAVVAACSPIEGGTTEGGTTEGGTTEGGTTLTSAPPTSTTLPGEDFASRATPIVTDFQIAEVDDGVYIGYIQHVSHQGMTGGRELQFDLGVWFQGEEADRMAAEDDEESPRPNGYYIRNLDPSHLLLEVSESVAVSSIWFDYAEPERTRSQISFEQFVEAMTGGTTVPAMRASPWWITIVNGEVTSIDEQYVP